MKEKEFFINLIPKQKRRILFLHIFFGIVFNIIFGVVLTLFFQMAFKFYYGKQVLAGFLTSFLGVLIALIVSYKKSSKYPLLLFEEVNFSRITVRNLSQSTVNVKKALFYLSREITFTNNGTKITYNLKEKKVIEEFNLLSGIIKSIEVNEIFIEEKPDYGRFEFIAYSFEEKGKNPLYILHTQEKIFFFMENSFFKLLKPLWKELKKKKSPISRLLR